MPQEGREGGRGEGRKKVQEVSTQVSQEPDVAKGQSVQPGAGPPQAISKSEDGPPETKLP